MGYKFNSKARKKYGGGRGFFSQEIFSTGEEAKKARCISSALMELKACMKVDERDW